MCTLHLFFRTFPGHPLVFAANRDELLDRAWAGPRPLASDPLVFGPVDLVAGGTWLGVNGCGVVAALANHEGTLRRGGSLCTRGVLVLEALRHPTAREAARRAEAGAAACKAYTLLVADHRDALVLDHDGSGGTRLHRLPPGCHVVTNSRFGDPDDPKAVRSRERMERLASGGAEPTDEELLSFLADHEPPAPGSFPLCIHPRPPDRFGTSSASVIRVDAEGAVSSFRFAEGPPCRTPLLDVTPAFASALRAATAGTAEGPPPP